MSDVYDLLQAVAETLGIKDLVGQLWTAAGPPAADKTRDAALNAFEDHINTLLNFNHGIADVPELPGNVPFRDRDVEPLLEQASSLLDRALADRAMLQTAGE